MPITPDFPPWLDIKIALLLSTTRSTPALKEALDWSHPEMDRKRLAQVCKPAARTLVKGKGVPLVLLDRTEAGCLQSELNDSISRRPRAISRKADAVLFKTNPALADLLKRCARHPGAHLYYTVEWDEESNDCFLWDILASPFPYAAWRSDGLSDSIATVYVGTSAVTLGEKIVEELVRAESLSRQSRRGW